jgi:hypothetical protein
MFPRPDHQAGKVFQDLPPSDWKRDLAMEPPSSNAPTAKDFILPVSAGIGLKSERLSIGGAGSSIASISGV